MRISNTRAILLATAAAVFLTGASGAGAPEFFGGPELVSDPGFETTPTSASAWTYGGNFQSTIFNSGLHSLRGGCVSAQCFSTQTLNLQPGIYRLSMFEGQNGGTPNEYSATLGAAPATIDVVNSPNTSVFGIHSGIVAATGGLTTLSLGILQVPGFGSIDDVSLFQIDDGQGNELAAVSQTVAVDASRAFLNGLYDRLGHSGSPMQTADAGQVMVASNDGMTYVNGPGNYRAFVSVTGYDGRYDSGDVRTRHVGFLIGAEWAPCNDWDIGVALSHGMSHFNASTLFTNNHGRADETLGALFAHWSPSQSPFYATGIVGYGQSDNDFTRDNFFGEVRANGVATTQWFGGVEAGYDWNGWKSFTLTPFARIDAASLRQDGYTETPIFGSLVPATVDSKDQTAARSLLGLRASTDVPFVGNYPWQISAKAAWQHDFNRNRSVTFSETSGVTFFGAASAAEPAANSAFVGASIEAPITKNASVYVAYDGNFGSGQQVQSGAVGFKVTW